ncbi:hypothetical protein WA026_017523 [Henosepilachna vigintioctopunctata]|uniref:C2H2-type domain-containing protein n=1 Tax=Henosepilachna vigintioctopunctata TaxID=420089 RepID=A0AAW1UVT7_9CUCU
MGTPGDNAKIGKVVKDELLDSSEQTTEDAPQVPSTSVAEEMGFLEVTQSQNQPLAPVNILVQPTPLPQLSGKPEIFTSTNLEQARLEDYYTQTKFYPTSYEPTTSYSVSSAQKPSKIFYSLEEPGPSGLQTPSKSKASTSLLKINVKKKVKPSPSLDSPKKPYTCQICQKSYANIDKLNKHQQIHSTVSPFKCEHCKKSFSSKFKLVRHMLIHSDRKPFSCTVCERTFHRKDHLKNHIKVHSPTKKVYICEKEHCKKEYTSLLSYKKHSALHAAQEGSLECQICSSVFRTKDDILFHLKIHAGSRTVKDPNEKKYRCEHCDRKFFTKKDVRRHLVVHTGMRDFLCQFCPQRFGRKDHLGRHIKKSHSKNLSQEDLDTSCESTSIKIETIVKSELITPELDHHQETSEEFFPSPSDIMPYCLEESSSSLMKYKPEFEEVTTLVGPKLLPYSLEGTTPIMKYEPKFEETSVAETQFSQSTITADMLEYSLDDVQEFFPESDMNKFLEESVKDDLNLMLSSPSQSEFIQIFEDINPSTSSSTLAETEVSNNSVLLTETEVLSNPEIQRLLQPSEEANLPLPGFSQTFQSVPPTQPPPPPPP